MAKDRPNRGSASADAPRTPDSRRRRAGWGWFALLLGLRLAAQPTTPFDVVLGRPTDRSVAVSLLATANLEVVVDYGMQPATYTNQSAATALTAGTPTVVTLDSLLTDTAYYYRVRYRTTGTADYTAGTEGRFVTQRAAGKTFTFAIEADPHHLDNEPAVWQATLVNILADQPDFLIDLGDTFMDEKFGSATYAQVVQTHKDVRTGFFSLTGPSVPLLLVNGNHDPEIGWLLSNTAPQANVAVWGVQARELYYPCPVPGGFYSGDTTTDAFTGAARDGYFAFEWGDALFVALDPFWYTSQGTPKGKDPWGFTLGRAQYDWLKRTLERSRATFKFIFLHNLVGGNHDGQGRGGVEFAPFYEWGGLDQDGTSGFETKRAGWPMPIQDLLLANRVNVVFHGHDHLYVKQDLDTGGDGVPDLIYQEVPQPSRSNQTTNSAAGYGYLSGTVFPSSGHLRVQVAPAQVTVEYVRAVVPADTRAGVANGTVMHRYTIAANGSSLPAIVVPPQPQTVALGSAATFSVTASSRLTLSYQWQRDGVNLPGATAASLTIPAVQAGDLGNYTVVVSTAAGAVTSNPVALSLSQGRLVNLSVRTGVAAGQTLIVGLVTDGPKSVLLRGVGPGLATVFPQYFQPGDVMADPRLELYVDGTLADENDNWSVGLAATLAGAGAFSLAAGSRDAALVSSVNGAVTAHLKGTGSGAVLVDAYDTTATYEPQLTNVSARSQVGTGDSVLIAGFVVDGTGTLRLLLRGVGPALSSLGVPGPLADPVLTLYHGSAVLATNDNWSDASNAAELAATACAVGAFALPAGGRDAALLALLPAGAYSAVVSGANGTTGTALVELYVVP